MSEVEKKLVNVEQLGILHEHNKQAYIAKNQGTENVGKVLAVDTEGTATPMSAPEVMDITYYEDENGKVLEFVSKEQLPGNVGIDSSLTLKGNAADAKVVGDILRRLNGGTGTGGSGGTLLPEDIEKAVEEYLKENPIDVKAIDVLDMIYDSQNQIIEFVDADSPFVIDPYLSTAGSAADAKAVGDALAAQAEYNELTYAKKGEVTNPDGTVNYDLAVIDDGQGNLVFGSDVSEVYSTDSKYTIYDNTDSGLEATTVKEAIDEVVDKIDEAFEEVGYNYLEWQPSNDDIAVNADDNYHKYYLVSDAVPKLKYFSGGCTVRLFEYLNTGKTETYELELDDYIINDDGLTVIRIADHNANAVVIVPKDGMVYEDKINNTSITFPKKGTYYAIFTNEANSYGYFVRKFSVAPGYDGFNPVNKLKYDYLPDSVADINQINDRIVPLEYLMDVEKSGHYFVDAFAVKELLLSGNGNISVSSITLGGGKLVWNADTASIDVIPVE